MVGWQSTRNLYNILPQRSQYYYYCWKFICSTRPADHRPAGTICSGVWYDGRGYGPLCIGMWVCIHYRTRHLYYVCASILTCGLNGRTAGLKLSVRVRLVSDIIYAWYNIIILACMYRVSPLLIDNIKLFLRWHTAWHQRRVWLRFRFSHVSRNGSKTIAPPRVKFCWTMFRTAKSQG